MYVYDSNTGLVRVACRKHVQRSDAVTDPPVFSYFTTSSPTIIPIYHLFLTTLLNHPTSYELQRLVDKTQIFCVRHHKLLLPLLLHLVCRFFDTLTTPAHASSCLSTRRSLYSAIHSTNSQVQKLINRAGRSLACAPLSYMLHA